MSLTAVLDRMQTEPHWRQRISYWHSIPARDAVTRPIPETLHPRLVEVLQRRGIDALYSHQAAAIEAIGSGQHTVVVTPTASGKTLCYNLPVLDYLLREPHGRAMYLFPTKALAQDQYAGLQSLIEELEADIKTYPYDGDTPSAERRMIRQAGNIVITNPDMLHSGILPHHTKWHELFDRLRYVVIDEMHGYRGVFGSHVANVIRRLRRVCQHYGSDPQFILASATIANPAELAERLIESPVALIDENGAPSGGREFILYNPPVVNAQLGIRRSATLEASDLAGELIKGGVHTIVFARARVTAEVLLTYLRERLPVRIGGKQAIRGYRGGYLPNQRREIERGLREGEIRGVVSTNALELGIDIGALDACVMTGYPGTIASAWQQAGRAGRGESTSAAFMVATASPLDQFIIRHPQYFFERTPETGLINPDNLLILVEHLKCAAFELPFKRRDSFGRYQPVEALEFLSEVGILHEVDGTFHWIADSYPAESISLRTAARENVVIIDQSQPAHPRVIGEVDTFAAPMLVHEDAIYIHDGQQYHVDRLDWDEQRAFVHPVSVEYFTDASLAVRVEVIDQFSDGGTSQRANGEVLVSSLVTQYKKVRLHTHENLGWGEVHLPEQQMHTTAYWMTIPDQISERVDHLALPGAVAGLANLLGNITPLYLMCDPRDIGVYAQARSPFTGLATVFIFDKVPGGIGFSERLYDVHETLLRAAHEHLTGCGCVDGCPACVGVSSATDDHPITKRATRILLDALVRDQAIAGD